MPALSNSKHEAFAYSVAKGSSQRDAYVTAGYADQASAASRLAKQPEVAARIEELRSDMQGAALALVKNPSPANIRRLADMNLSLDWCAQQFKEIAEEARIAGQFSAATTAIKNIQGIIELSGKENKEDAGTEEDKISVENTLALLDKMQELAKLQMTPETADAMIDITPPVKEVSPVAVLQHVTDLEDDPNHNG